MYREALALIRDPNTPPEVLAQLADQYAADLGILRYLATHPNITPELLTHLWDQHPSDYPLARDLASQPNTPLHILEALARAADMVLLERIAANPSTPTSLLALLWDHPHVAVVRKEYEINPNPRDFAGYDASDEDALVSLEYSIARHANTPPDLLMRLVSEVRFGGSIALNPAATTAILDAIAGNPDQYAPTLAAMSRHPNASDSALAIAACRVPLADLPTLADHPRLSPAAREVIAYRQGAPTASPEALTLLVTHGYGDAHARIASDPTTPPDLLRALARSRYPAVRAAAERNPNTPR